MWRADSVATCVARPEAPRRTRPRGQYLEHLLDQWLSRRNPLKPVIVAGLFQELPQKLVGKPFSAEFELIIQSSCPGCRRSAEGGTMQRLPKRRSSGVSCVRVSTMRYACVRRWWCRVLASRSHQGRRDRAASRQRAGVDVVRLARVRLRSPALPPALHPRGDSVGHTFLKETQFSVPETKGGGRSCGRGEYAAGSEKPFMAVRQEPLCMHLRTTVLVPVRRGPPKSAVGRCDCPQFSPSSAGLNPTLLLYRHTVVAAHRA